jgi:hypothetical protein
MRLPKPQSTLGRAVLPVLGGIGFFALLALATWIAAVFLSRNPDRVSERFLPTTFDLSATRMAKSIAKDGPIILGDLSGPDGKRTLVLDHTGDSPLENFQAYFAYPSDRDPSCAVVQVKHTRQFTASCDGRTIEVEQLAPAQGVTIYPNIDDELITIDLRPPRTTTTTTAVTSSTT